MDPIMPVSVPSACGSKNAIAPCVATRYPRMRCVLVACLPGVATSSIRRTELTWQGSCSKEELPGILIACSWLTSGYQLSNDHPESLYPPGVPTFPQAVIQYGLQVCPGCSAWANGTYQCVSFVRGAYSQVYPMTLTANAFDLWATYAGQPGWQEIPGASAPPGQRGIPAPGDIVIFKDAGIGHAGIVMSVALPTATMDDVITFSTANSVSPD